MTRHLAALLDWFLRCPHRGELGPPWQRGGKTYRTCLSCSRPVLSTLADPLGPDGKPLIRQPVLSAPVDLEARAAQVRRCYEELAAIRGRLPAETALERMARGGRAVEPAWVKEAGVRW